MSLVLATAGGVLVVFLLLTFVLSRIKVAGPNEAFIITGRRGRSVTDAQGLRSTDMSGQKVVMGASVFVLPVYPIAAIGIIFFGLGLLPFAPVTAGLAALTYSIGAGRRGQRPFQGLIWWGVITGILVVLALDVPTAMTRYAVRASTSLDAGQRARAVRQVRQERQERVPAVGQTVQQQQGLASERAGLDVFDRHAGRKGDVLDVRVHPLLPR